MLFCTKCGTQLEQDALFCSRCGAATASQETPNPETKIQELLLEKLPYAERGVRCVQCGSVIYRGTLNCPSCGQAALTPEEFAAKNADFEAIRRFRRKMTIMAVIGALVLAFLIFCSISSPIEIAIIAVLMIMIPYMVVFLVLRRIWYKKMHLEKEAYKAKLVEYKSMSKSYFKPIPLPKKPKIKTNSKYTPQQILKQRNLCDYWRRSCCFDFGSGN